MVNEKVKEVFKDEPLFTKLTDLAAEKLGGKTLYCTDDFFAEKENLIKPGRGVFIAEKFTDRGKWMDGWESKRKRIAGHDWVVIQLATQGIIKGLDIDTNFFLGNNPPFASVEAVNIDNKTEVENWDELPWVEVVSKNSLDAGSHNYFEVVNENIFTHLRLHIYPDGGVARFRVYGNVFIDWSKVAENEEIDLASVLWGASPLACNDMFFSSMENLLLPGKGINMGDGWETKRNRTANNKDWVIIKLGIPGVIDKIVVDTAHFKGNYPDCCTLEACNCHNDKDVLEDKVNWVTILPSQKLEADAEHTLEKEIAQNPVCTHVRLNIFPDGGVSRLRLWGKKQAY
ncbi:MAG: allantoicase [Chitinophagaceae bacterium]|nr:allantoicase [Chitinophagaceae bacterium]